MDFDFDSKMFPVEPVMAFLRQYEMKNGYTKADVARKIGWTQQAYGEIKRHKRISGFRVRQIADGLNIPLEKIVGEANSEIVSILSKYPLEVLRWLASDDGKSAIVLAYRDYLKILAENAIKHKIDDVSLKIKLTPSINKD